MYTPCKTYTQMCTPFKSHAQTHVKKCRKYEMYAQINSLMNNKSVVSAIEM